MNNAIERLVNQKPPRIDTLVTVVVAGAATFTLFMTAAPVIAGVGLVVAALTIIALHAIYGGDGARALWRTEGRLWVWGRRRLRWVDAVIVGALVLAALVGSDLWLQAVATWGWQTEPTPWVTNASDQVTAGGGTTVRWTIRIVVLAPLFEEFLYRGVLLHAMLRSRMPAVLAVILSSTVFALGHTAYPATLQVTTFILGCASAVATLRCRTFLAGVVVHAAWNALFVLTAMHLL